MPNPGAPSLGAVQDNSQSEAAEQQTRLLVRKNDLGKAKVTNDDDDDDDENEDNFEATARRRPIFTTTEVWLDTKNYGKDGELWQLQWVMESLRIMGIAGIMGNAGSYWNLRMVGKAWNYGNGSDLYGKPEKYGKGGKLFLKKEVMESLRIIIKGNVSSYRWESDHVTMIALRFEYIGIRCWLFGNCSGDKSRHEIENKLFILLMFVLHL